MGVPSKNPRGDDRIANDVDASDTINNVSATLNVQASDTIDNAKELARLRWWIALGGVLLRWCDDVPFDIFGKSDARQQRRLLEVVAGWNVASGCVPRIATIGPAGWLPLRLLVELQLFRQRTVVVDNGMDGTLDDLGTVCKRPPAVELLNDADKGAARCSGVGEASVEPESIPMFKPRRIPRGGRKNKR